MPLRQQSSESLAGTSSLQTNLADQPHAPRGTSNLLVLAFHYPPDNTSTGVLRTFKFTQYLLRHDWRSHVISVPERLYTSRNPPGADAIPSAITVERPWACDVKSMFGIRGVYPGWLALPDRHWPWLFAGSRAGARAIRKFGIDAIYSTSPVPTAHLIARRLKKRFGLPWLADFRDPWVEGSMPWWRQKVEGWMERAVVEAADQVICNTPAMQRAFLLAYPHIAKSKFVTITNGYDEADLANVTPVRVDKFQILHPGVIDAENRNPASLLRGVRKALDNGWLHDDNLQISFLGAGPYGNSTQFRRDIERTRLERIVDVVSERIPYRDALARMAGADVVVLLSEHLAESGRLEVQEWTSMQVPAKLYEYLRLGRPMLALVSEGAVKDLLVLAGVADPIPPSDIERVAFALKDHYAARKPPPSTLPNATAAVMAYSRENLTRQLARQLDTLVAGAQRDRASPNGADLR